MGSKLHGVEQKTIIVTELSGVFLGGDGREIDLGVIASPYPDRLRNEAWKLRQSKRIHRLLDRMEMWVPWHDRMFQRMLMQEGMASVYTSVGKNWVADKMRYTNNVAVGLVNTQPNDTPRFVGWGTGAGTAAVGDTTLFTESSDPASRATATLSGVTTTVTGDTFQAVGTLTSSTTQTITNAGLFDTVTTGDMVMKGDHAGVPLLANDAIQYTFKLQQT
jgi:hypothetical protein